MNETTNIAKRSFFAHPMAKWGMVILTVFVVWFAGWFAIARFVDGKIVDVVAGLDKRGISVECGNRRVVGFPFRMGIFCDRVNVDDSVHDYQLTTSGLRSAAQIYAPRKNIVEVVSPVSFSAQRQELTAQWENMRLYIEQKGKGFDQLSMNWKGVVVQTGDTTARADSAALHLRPNPSAPKDLDLAGSTDNLILNDDERLRASITYDTHLSGAYEAIIENRKRPADWLVAGGVLEVRSLFISLPEGGRLALSGPLSVGANGMLNGKVQFGLDDADALAKFVTGIDPQFGPAVLGLSQGIGLIGKETAFGDRKIRAVTVTIDDGWTQVGPFKLGRLPPVL